MPAPCARNYSLVKMILNDVNNIEKMHAHAEAAVLVRYPRYDIADFWSADEKGFAKLSLRSQRYSNIEFDGLKVAFACAWLRRYVQKIYSVKWERSREDSNCMLEDGSEILGYNVKLKKNMLMKSVQEKMMTQTQTQKLFVLSLIGNYK